MKEFLNLLKERNAWDVADAKPCRIYINQAYRQGVAVLGDKIGDFNVAYVMPNGRMYVKNVSMKEAESTIYTGQPFLQIDMKTSINEEGGFFSAFGF